MSARRKPPSMLELCHFFRKKKELMRKENSEDSERQNISSCRRTVGRGPMSSVVNSAVALQERNAIITNRDPPLRLTQAGYSNEVYETRISSSYLEKKRSWCYAPDKKKTYAARFPLFEDYDLINPRIGPLHSPVGCLEEDNVQAAKRNRYDKMSLPQREVKKRTKTMPQEKRRDTRSVYPQNPANTRRYSSLHLASTEGYSYNQIQDGKEKRTSNGTVKTFVKKRSIQQHREMGPTRRRNGFYGRETKLPPIQQADMVMVPFPRLLKTEEQHRHHREEVCEERNLFGSRRNGVCQETDETRQHRTFVRVLSKRL